MSVEEFDNIVTDLMTSKKTNAKELIERIRRRSSELSKNCHKHIEVLYTKIIIGTRLEFSNSFKEWSNISIVKDRSDPELIKTIHDFGAYISSVYPEIFWCIYMYDKYQFEDIFDMVLNRIYISSDFFTNCLKRNYNHILELLRNDVFGSDHFVNKQNVIRMMEYKDRSFFDALNKDALIECKKTIDNWLESDTKYNPDLYQQITSKFHHMSLDTKCIDKIAKAIEDEYSSHQRSYQDDSPRAFVDKYSLQPNDIPWNLQSHYNDYCMYYLSNLYKDLVHSENKAVNIGNCSICDPFNTNKWENIQNIRRFFLKVGLMCASAQPISHLAIKLVPFYVDWTITHVDGGELVTW